MSTRICSECDNDTFEEAEDGFVYCQQCGVQAEVIIEAGEDDYIGVDAWTVHRAWSLPIDRVYRRPPRASRWKVEMLPRVTILEKGSSVWLNDMNDILLKGVDLPQLAVVVSVRGQLEKSSAARESPIAKAAFSFLQDHVSSSFSFAGWNGGRIMCQRSQLKQLLSTKEPTSEESQNKNLVELTNLPIFVAGTRTRTYQTHKGDVATELPCKHIYHFECVKKWLEVHATCPQCRYEMPFESEKEVVKNIDDNDDDENSSDYDSS